MTFQLAKASDVDGRHLLDKNSGRLSAYLDLGTVGGRTSAQRGRRHQHDQTRQKFVRLNQDAVAIAPLLMPGSFRDQEPVHVTAEHAASPSFRPRRAFPVDPSHRPRAQPTRPRVPSYGAADSQRRSVPTESPPNESFRSAEAAATPVLRRRRAALRSLAPYRQRITNLTTRMLVAPPISPDGSAAPVDAFPDFFLGETLASLADDPQVPEGIAQATLTRAVLPDLDRDDHLRSTRLHGPSDTVGIGHRQPQQQLASVSSATRRPSSTRLICHSTWSSRSPASMPE